MSKVSIVAISLEYRNFPRDNFRFWFDRFHIDQPGLTQWLGNGSVQELGNEGNRPVVCQDLRLSLLAVIVALWPTARELWAQTQEAKPASDDWVQHVAPGIRIVGPSNLSALHFTTNIYAMTQDGKFLPGCRGRRLVLLDIDSTIRKGT